MFRSRYYETKDSLKINVIDSDITEGNKEEKIEEFGNLLKKILKTILITDPLSINKKTIGFFV